MIASRRPQYVVTANVDFLVQARRDEELRRILVDADMVLCDGTPLVWASRLLGNPLPERVAGSDLVPQFLRVAARKKYRLFFLGATAEANELAAKNVQARFPGVNIVGHYSPPFQPLLEMDNHEIARIIRASDPDVLCVAFGCPKAEKWIAMNYRSLGVPVTIGVGATIDFLAGKMRRAPVWMQRAGIEWIFRLCQEPRRLFKRYFTDMWVFSGSITTQFWAMRSRPRKLVNGPVTQPMAAGSSWQSVQVLERLDAQAVRQAAKSWENLMATNSHCQLDLAQVKFIDSTGAAILARLQNKLRARGRHLILLSPSAAVIRSLSLMRWRDFFEIGHDASKARELIQAREAERRAQVLNGMWRPLIWRGEITSTNAAQIWKATRKEICSMNSGCKLWIVDLSQVRFMDSSGVKVMQRVKQYAPLHGTQVRFTQVPPTVKNVIRESKQELALLDAAA
jgi:N-acetylglucosaminyldiphosphoundecaprenol N-acetyl-beta-D-mannosaminyltransferase